VIVVQTEKTPRVGYVELKLMEARETLPFQGINVDIYNGGLIL
jgi:hypothetical protein